MEESNLNQIRSEMAATRTEIGALRKELQDANKELRDNLRADIAQVQKDISALKTELFEKIAQLNILAGEVSGLKESRTTLRTAVWWILSVAGALIVATWSGALKWLTNLRSTP